MKIAVCVKQTIDTEAVIALDEQGEVMLEGQALVIDPYGEFAVEKALQLKEACGGEVVILTVGGQEAVPAVRQALAMGADSAVLIDDPALAGSDASGVAAVLAAALGRLSCDLVMGGCKSADTAGAQVMVRVAAIMGLVHVNVATALEVDGAVAHVTREVDDGIELIDVPLPAVISAQQGLAEPRYPNVREIMRSKKKQIEAWTLDELGIDPASVGSAAAKLQVVSRQLKPARCGGRIIEGGAEDAVATLVGLLKDEAKAV